MNNLPLSCRSCGQTGLRPVLSLGRLPLVNALLTAAQLTEPEPTYPLDVVFCPHCALVQITETVPPEVLFREYLYFSSFSETMLRHADTLAERLVNQRRLDDHCLVVEIASNDGYLLQYYLQRGVPVLGIEPALNVAQVAQTERGIPTLTDFFGLELAHNLKNRQQQADVIHAHNVLAHVADLNGVVEGLAVLLKDDGVAVIEAPYVKDLIDRGEFDTIYHEHLCYFSLTALDNLFRRHGLIIQEVERTPMHGGSLLIFVAKAGVQGESARQLLQQESAWGLDKLDFYQDFACRVVNSKEALRNQLLGLKGTRHRLAAYGASAKGCVLLNYCGLGRETLDFVVDRNIHKQHRYMPGVRLPIYPPARLVEAMPDYVVLLVWNFADEILAQQAEYRARGGQFIIPIPNIKIV